MNLEEARYTYSEIDELYSVIEKQQLRFEILPPTEELRDACFRKVALTKQDTTFTIPVDDEFEDAELKNPALLLQLIIYAIEEYEDLDDFLVWCTAYGLKAENPTHLEWYRQLGELTPKIREIIGNDLTGISDFDWQLNAGPAQALRELAK